MDILIKGKTYIVCGASSGFGNGIAIQLIEEGANVIAIARGEEKLRELQDAYPSKVELLPGDITDLKFIDQLAKHIEGKRIDGILVNAGGPPASTFIETKLEDWDQAYTQLLRWKVKLTQALLPKFLKQCYGRFLYIESSAVKQPLENLVLSTSLRLSVVGFVKTVSQEIPDKGVTFNILAPGYHNTAAVERLIAKRAEQQKIAYKQAKEQIEQAIPMRKSGDVAKISGLGAWLLSPQSEFITGQVFTVDGGTIKSTL